MFVFHGLLPALRARGVSGGTSLAITATSGSEAFQLYIVPCKLYIIYLYPSTTDFHTVYATIKRNTKAVNMPHVTTKVSFFFGVHRQRFATQ